MKPLHVISLGAGVQSTTMALMAAHGAIEPMPDAAIFADTFAEPQPVYEHLEWLRSPNVLPFPVHVVSVGKIVDDTLLAIEGVKHGKGRSATAPFFTKGKKGDAAPLRRQCTDAYKTEPFNKQLRRMHGVDHGERWPAHIPPAHVWLGISKDEAHRMKPSRENFIVRRWPLIELEMSRWDCKQWLRRHEYPIPMRSACTICPYRRDSEWRELRDADADGFEEAVSVDRAIRPGMQSRVHNPDANTGPLWLHRSMKPLERVDLRTAEEKGQPDMFGDECEGMCGL